MSTRDSPGDKGGRCVRLTTYHPCSAEHQEIRGLNLPGPPWAIYIILDRSRSCYSFQILMKLEFSRQIFKKYSNIKFNENPTSKSRGVPCRRMDGQADMTKVTVAFHNFPRAPKNSTGIWAWQDRATIRTDAAKIKSFRS